MNSSQRRLRTIVMAYGIAASLVFSYLAYLMVVQHESWELRSYGNRWAFRDVPTRRGSIRDRHGQILVKDTPTTSLSVYYREFRRRHPCGVSIHGANICARLVDGKPRYSYSENDVRRAFRHCLYLPMSVLRVKGDEQRFATDLQFYTAALFASLTDGASYWSRYRRIRQILRKSVETGVRGSVCQVLGFEPKELEEVFDSRLQDLCRIANVMTASDRDLWSLLEAKRTAYIEDWLVAEPVIKSEMIPRVLHPRLSYELARFLSVRKELHPGLMIRASVDRDRASSSSLGDSRWGSIGPLLGGVTLEWGTDSDKLRRRSFLDEIIPVVESMATADTDLSEGQRRRVQEGLKGTMSNHLAAQGRVGRGGIERDLDPVLRGTAGLHWFLRSRGRQELGLWSSFDVTPGDDVFLTVDLRLQHLMEEALDQCVAQVEGSPVAAFCVIDPRTGDVLALASRPLPSDRSEMRMEPAISWWTTGDIGSLAKPFVLLEHLDALRRGRAVIHHRAFVPCRGGERMPSTGRFRRHNLRCDHVHGDSVHDCVESLGKSCNYFFFQVAEGLGWPGVSGAFSRFGLRRPAGQPIPAAFQAHLLGIPAAQYPDPSWGRGDIHRRSIGYGIEANVLQVARAYAGLATGRLPELSLVTRDAESLKFQDLGVHVDDLRMVRDGLRFCVEQGTARRLDLKGVYAKTGTAEVNASSGANNAWLAGYVVEGGPKLAFASVLYNVPDGSYGAAVAGPMIQYFLAGVRGDKDLSREFLQR
jgi:cell division protein FtsI/penicillin-binding protein 2